MPRIKRRDFIAMLSGAAVWPLVAPAQELRRIGMLMEGPATDPIRQARVKVFTEQIRKLGWTEGQNLRTEYRWDEGDPALDRTNAEEMIASRSEVILCAGTQNLIALQRLSPVTPIVFIQVSDPLAQGFVTNMAHPGANITGFAYYEFSVGGKWLDLLKQMVPSIDHVGVMFNPEVAPQTKLFMNSIESAARTLGVKVVAAPVHTVVDFEPAVAGLVQEQNGGVIVPTDSFMIAHRREFVEAIARHRVPVIMPDPGSVRDGVLMSYYAEITDQYRQAGVYVDRILRGTKPGDLSVQAPTKFALSINLKTARALGIEVPLSLLLLADEQVE